MPLANGFLAHEQLNGPEDFFPLDLFFCNNCGLAQIGHVVPPEKLFSDYAYFSSHSIDKLKFYEALAQRIVTQHSLDERSLVIEIGSNDGYLLRYYKARGVPILGIEPSTNVARVAETIHKIPTIKRFFGQNLAVELRQQGWRADVIHAHNVLAHIENLHDFFQSLNLVIRDTGIAVLEVPYVKNLIQNGLYDMIYHEHLYYFSIKALKYLTDAHRFTIESIELTPNQGGSLNLTIRKRTQPDNPKELVLAEEEDLLEVNDFRFYADFDARINQHRRDLRNLIRQVKASGKSIVGYGASAKGTILLNFCGFNPGHLDFVVDNIEYKQGRYIPGVHIPIREPKALRRTQPDYCLVLAWNALDEIVTHETLYRSNGGRFIVPFPEIRIW